MAEPFLAEIRMVSFNWPPKGWAFCEGQLLPINQNQALFALLGTAYGGNAQTTFALPNLQGRVPIGRGAGRNLATSGGEASHTVTTSEMPTHSHALAASSSTTGGSSVPAGRFLGSANNMDRAPESLTAMHPGTISAIGGSQPHTNRQPYIAIRFCIALQGIFPTQN